MKIVQITSTSAIDYDDCDSVYALCDDGSVWRLTYVDNVGWQWSRMPALPKK